MRLEWIAKLYITNIDDASAMHAYSFWGAMRSVFANLASVLEGESASVG